MSEELGDKLDTDRPRPVSRASEDQVGLEWRSTCEVQRGVLIRQRSTRDCEIASERGRIGALAYKRAARVWGFVGTRIPQTANKNSLTR